MCSKKRQIFLIGIGMGTELTLTEEAKKAIEEADVVIGAGRMAEPFEKMGKVCFYEYRPQEVRDYLYSHPQYKKCALVLSGDTGFYSGAAKLAEVLEGEITYIPGISSVVYLAAKLGTSWEDGKLMSLHGRQQNVVYAISHNRKTFLLMGKDSGEILCEKIKYYDLTNVVVHIGNRLSYEDERIISKKGDEVRPEDFSELSVVMVENPHPDSRICPHLKDEEFIRADGDKKVPMTKEEVRTVSIGKLMLTENAVLYDVGAGTGSVSIEAAGMAEGIRVYAIEKNPDACALIRKNRQKFRTDQVEIIEGKAPDVLRDLELPTHVFIGGSAGKLKEIIRCVKEKNPKARLVINAISLETLREVMETMEEGLLLEPEIVQLTAAKSRKLGSYHMMTGQNPIYIVSE